MIVEVSVYQTCFAIEWNDTACHAAYGAVSINYITIHSNGSILERIISRLDIYFPLQLLASTKRFRLIRESAINFAPLKSTK